MRGDLYSRFESEQNIEQKKEDVTNVKEEIVMINIALLDEFNNHIFSAISKNKFEELKESISRSGVLSPILVRKKEDRYEIISGHNRVKCCKELGLKEIPAIIKDYDNDMAELIMIETNLAQRENILPCEKGLAYKKQLELIKKLKKESQEKSTDTNTYESTAQIEQENYSVEKLANESEDSRATIQRFIRLTELNADLKHKVNNDILGVMVGVELSYLKDEEQEVVNEVIDEMNIKLTMAQAKKLREVYGTITQDNVLEIINGKKKDKIDKFTGKLSRKVYKKYKEKFDDDYEFSEIIDVLLENYFKNMSDK